MAHGLLQSDNGNEEPESVGMRYINELRWRCLFQDFEQNFDFISFEMHDLVHDLATKIAKNECFIMDSHNRMERATDSRSRMEYCRHLSVADVVQGKLSGSKMTRSILYFEMIRPSQSLMRSCITQFPNLRVLDFRNSDMEVLSESIGKLKHLRYLNLTKNIKIKRLPKSIFKLRFLETLLLGGCKMLEELPEDIWRLVNLRMLVFSSKQSRLPENGIGCLTSLKYLGIGSCYNLENLFEDIGKLQALRTLIIGDCPKLVSLPHGVKDLSSLENLMLSDSRKNSKCSLETEMEMDLERQSVKPHGEMLCIDGLPEFKELPRWLLPCSANTLMLSDRKKSVNGNLEMEMGLQSRKPHLRMLCIDGLPEFKELPQWILQCSTNSTLQRLAIKNCPNFEKLPAEPQQILKSLEVLEIWNCPKFSSLPEGMHHLTVMRELKVRGCPDLSEKCKRGTDEDGKKINHIPKIELDGKAII